VSTEKTALVTGGAKGLGAASAQRLRADGLAVVTLDLADADVSCDVTDEQALRKVAIDIGPVDIIINSAGIVGPNKASGGNHFGRVGTRPRRQRPRDGKYDEGLRPRHAGPGLGRGCEFLQHGRQGR
jgi:NAD(P)-dependent dehydrogenase (short-subunit alcohol dehydrogenase family)